MTWIKRILAVVCREKTAPSRQPDPAQFYRALLSP